MNTKRCKLLRKIALLVEQNSKETLYFKNKNTGAILVGKCVRANYLAMKKSERKKNTPRNYLKQVIMELTQKQIQSLEKENV